MVEWDEDNVLKWILSIAGVLGTAAIVGLFLSGIKIALVFTDTFEIWGIQMVTL